MSQHSVVSREEWKRARIELLAEEKAMTKALDALAEKRRALPWVAVDKNYKFAGPNGTQTLTELFGVHRQLVVYHFMYGPDWEEGCTSCSFWADNYNGLDVHLANRDTALTVISNTSLNNIEAYRQRMGWQFNWYSSLGSGFNRDFHVSSSPDEQAAGGIEYNFRPSTSPMSEAPGLSVFIKDDEGKVAHSYSCYARGLDIFNSAYQILDMTPLGRDEGEFPFTMAWLRRHDQYGERNA
jgi:predicted dithiol-disulfide oxidoreductase (DUF899 family)